MEWKQIKEIQIMAWQHDKLWEEASEIRSSVFQYVI